MSAAWGLCDDGRRTRRCCKAVGHRRDKLNRRIGLEGLVLPPLLKFTGLKINHVPGASSSSPEAEDPYRNGDQDQDDCDNDSYDDWSVALIRVSGI